MRRRELPNLIPRDLEEAALQLIPFNCWLLGFLKRVGINPLVARCQAIRANMSSVAKRKFTLGRLPKDVACLLREVETEIAAFEWLMMNEAPRECGANRVGVGRCLGM